MIDTVEIIFVIPAVMDTEHAQNTGDLRNVS